MRRGACSSLRKRRDARTVRSSHLLGTCPELLNELYKDTAVVEIYPLFRREIKELLQVEIVDCDGRPLQGIRLTMLDDQRDDLSDICVRVQGTNAGLLQTSDACELTPPPSFEIPAADGVEAFPLFVTASPPPAKDMAGYESGD